MAQFKAFDPRVEVNGQTVLAVVAGSAIKEIGFEILAQNGIVNPDPACWYPQQAWLDAFRTIAERIGPNTLYNIGYRIPENAKFPPGIDSVEKALASIDVAYHMNHRIGTEVLFNPVTGAMKEGIGHYGYEKIGERRVRMVCNNPYPCDFDRGIIESMAKRFKPAASLWVAVDHDDTQPCRKKGADSCTYLVSW